MESEAVTELPQMISYFLYIFTDRYRYRYMYTYGYIWASPVVKNLSASVGDIRDLSSMPGSERSPGGGHGNPLQYSCLENPMDGGQTGYSPWDCKESDLSEAT